MQEKLTETVIGAAIEVHKILGPGLLESVYQECLCYELGLRGVRCQPQVDLPIMYKQVALDCGYRMDLVVEDAVIVELKSIEVLLPVHEAQLMTYLRVSNKRVGLLINFGAAVLKDGLVRRVR